ncbi:MAG: hypothetical protein QNJ94_06385 [Alphaproteobacteria bacterium]|nr:hypothetical protein [Alphaproteobacteria bacterium]
MSRLLAIAALALAAGLTRTDVAVAAEPAEIAQRIEKRFGVKVLQISRVERKGQQLYALRVMTPGGAHNDAWQVNELLVSPRSGRLISTFRHRTSGYAVDGPVPPVDKVVSPKSLIRVSLPPHGRSVRVLAPKSGATDGRPKSRKDRVTGDR